MVHKHFYGEFGVVESLKSMDNFDSATGMIIDPRRVVWFDEMPQVMDAANQGPRSKARLFINPMCPYKSLSTPGQCCPCPLDGGTGTVKPFKFRDRDRIYGTTVPFWAVLFTVATHR